MGYLLRAPQRLIGLPLIIPTVLRFLLGSADHGEVKSAFIRNTLGGLSRATLEAWTVRFVARLRHRGLFADALQTIAAHQRAGARLVLLSASTDLYVPVIAQTLGFNETICTEVRWCGDRLDGHLASPNRRGHEKARCFEALRRAYPGLRTAAYGNSGADLDHLRLADQPLLVNAPARARREAQRLGIPCALWR